MKKIIAISIFISISGVVHAGTYVNALNRCFANSTTGKDRTDLARLFFTAMAQHPDMSDLSSIQADKKEAILKSGGLIYTRLLGDVCSKELGAAVKNEGESAVRASYEFLGRLAMQELMANPSVADSISGMEKYVDSKKINAAIHPQ